MVFQKSRERNVYRSFEKLADYLEPRLDKTSLTNKELLAMKELTAKVLVRSVSEIEYLVKLNNENGLNQSHVRAIALMLVVSYVIERNVLKVSKNYNRRLVSGFFCGQRPMETRWPWRTIDRVVEVNFEGFVPQIGNVNLSCTGFWWNVRARLEMAMQQSNMPGLAYKAYQFQFSNQW